MKNEFRNFLPKKIYVFGGTYLHYCSNAWNSRYLLNSHIWFDIHCSLGIFTNNFMFASMFEYFFTLFGCEITKLLSGAFNFQTFVNDFLIRMNFFPMSQVSCNFNFFQLEILAKSTSYLK